MVTAIILIQTHHGKISEVAQKLAELPQVSEVYSVGGSYDVVAIVRTPDNEGIAALVTDTMVDIKGIERTETMIAFKTYSRHDLEAMFALGMESGGD
jgi:DNA-binding Lrp family transcriptional regulator